MKKCKPRKLTALLLALALLLSMLPTGIVLAQDTGGAPPDPILYLDMEDVSDGKLTNLMDGKTFDIQGSYEQIASANGTKALSLDGQHDLCRSGQRLPGQRRLHGDRLGQRQLSDHRAGVHFWNVTHNRVRAECL